MTTRADRVEGGKNNRPPRPFKPGQWIVRVDMGLNYGQWLVTPKTCVFQPSQRPPCYFIAGTASYSLHAGYFRLATRDELLAIAAPLIERGNRLLAAAQKMQPKTKRAAAPTGD